MIDITTYIVYVLLLVFVVTTTAYLSRKRTKSEVIYDPNRINLVHILVLLLLSFVIGFRFEVGVDWYGYKSDYNYLTTSSLWSFSDQYYELGFYAINWFYGILGLGYQWMFFTMAFISWLFYFKSVPKYIIPLFVFFLFTDEYLFWGMNGVRQFASMALWVFSVKFIIDKDLKYFVLTLIFASLLHSSSILLVPLYFVPYSKMYNQNLWIILYLMSLVVIIFLDLSTIYQNLDVLVITLSSEISAVERYARYAESGRLVAQETSLGLGFAFKIVVNFIIIFLSKNWIEREPSMKPYVVLFFIGAILFNLFYEFQLINRLTNYFLIFRPLVLAYIVYNLWVYHKDRFIGPTILFLYFLIFLASIYGNSNMCCPYQISF